MTSPPFPSLKSRIAAVCAFVVALSGTPLSAQTPPKEIRLSLADSIALALKSNLTLRQQRLDPKIRDAQLEAAKDRFNPVFSTTSGVNRSQLPTSNPFLAGAPVQTSAGQDVGLGFTDPLKTGGSYGLSFNTNRATSNSRNAIINPSYRSTLALDVSQPLLNGFRTSPELASITVAQNEQEISSLMLKGELIRTLSDVQAAYWELVFARSNLEVQQLALRQARDLLRRAERMREMEKATVSDTLQAQSVVSMREANEIAAQGAVEDAQDELKRLTNPDEFDAASDVSILPTDAPTFVETSANLPESVQTALSRRHDVLAAQIDLKSREEFLKVSENQRLPRLDLEGSLSLNGLGGRLDDPLTQVGKAEHRAWRVGLALRVPFDGQGADAELVRGRIEREQARIALRELEQQAVADVRFAVRQLETGKRRVEATRSAEEFARQAVAVEERKHELGLTTIHDLLELQSALAEASTAHVRALIDYRLATVALHRAQGTSLDALGVPDE